MSCKNTIWKVVPYVDGELPTEEHEDVATHLSECPECAKMAEEFGTLDRIAGRDTAPPVSSDEWANMLHNVTSRGRHARPVATRRAWEWLVPVASLAALVLLAVLLGPGLVTAPPRSPEGVEAVLPESGASEAPPGTILEDDEDPAHRRPRVPPGGIDG